MTWLFKSIILSNELYLQNVWTRHDIWYWHDYSNRLNRTYKRCNAMLTDFQIRFAVWFDHDLIRFFIRDYKTHWHDYSSQLSRQMNYICETRSTSNASWYWFDFESIVSLKRLYCRVVDFQIRFCCTICSRLDHICDCFYLWLFFCQYQCLVTDARILNVCF